MERKKVFITVKTYPNPSASYVETVCTAGIVEGEGWIRLYPVPYRVSEGYTDKQFKKYQWITVDVVKRPANSGDKRPESYSPQAGTMELGQIIPPTSPETRKDIIFRNTTKYDDFEQIFALAREFKISLATFEPSEIVKFYATPCENKDWTQEERAKLDREIRQKDFFLEDSIKSSNLRKVPFVFKFKLKDAKGRTSDMMIEDWEVGACYWNMLARSRTEEEAAEKVVAHYNQICAKSDCIFFLGTTNKFHNLGALNPFVIIGLFHTPKTAQAFFKF